MSDPYDSLSSLIPAALPQLSGLSGLLGFDGTVDVICKPVQSRTGVGEDYAPFPTIRDFGERVVAADGMSAIVEIVKEQEKIGGNGPIMANALATSGVGIHYVGALGSPDIHAAYASFAAHVHCHSIAAPAVTHALEFDNGKIMLAAIF